jgi:hypothetical protein
MAPGSFANELQQAVREEPVRIAYRVHESHGRVRFRLTWLRHRPDLAAALADALSAVEGVAQVRVRHFTGSVLVLFDPARSDGERIAAALLQATGLPRVTLPGHESGEDIDRLLDNSHRKGSDLSLALVRTIEGLHADFLRLSGGHVSLGVLMTLSMWMGAAAKMAHDARIEPPPWYQLVWWGFKSFYDLERAAIENAPDVGELARAG